MKNTTRRPNIRNFVSGLAAGGHYFFASHEARSAIGVSPAAAKLALNRLARQGSIVSPTRGYYVILPPEYQSLGCLPADQFIPALMKNLGQAYYAGLLSAAQYHGAAHHRPQEFQVFLAKNRRPIQYGSVRVASMARKRIADVAVQAFNTPRGPILVSIPEATAIDLVGYQHRVGGLDQVATILSELVEKINPGMLAVAAATAPILWTQRLGYLLEQIGADQKASALGVYVQKHARLAAMLLPAMPRADSRRDDRWNLYLNAEVEMET